MLIPEDWKMDAGQAKNSTCMSSLNLYMFVLVSRFLSFYVFLLESQLCFAL